jgi:hypothetical protein
MVTVLKPKPTPESHYLAAGCFSGSQAPFSLLEATHC